MWSPPWMRSSGLGSALPAGERKAVGARIYEIENDLRILGTARTAHEKKLKARLLAERKSLIESLSETKTARQTKLRREPHNYPRQPRVALRIGKMEHVGYVLTMIDLRNDEKLVKNLGPFNDERAAENRGVELARDMFGPSVLVYRES